MTRAELQQIGRRLASAGRRPVAVDARAIERLTLALHPDLAEAKRDWEQEQVLRSRYAPGRIAKYDGKLSGYGPGRTGQCGGCKAPRGYVQTGPCPHCGYVEGAGYLGVPAQSSYLERWK